MNAYYYDTGYYKIQKSQLDKYFEESYWQDVDFYFFVLLKHSDIRTKVAILHAVYLEEMEDDFIRFGIEERIVFLESVATKLGLDVRDISRMPSFVAFFDTLIPEISRLRDS